MRFLHTLIVPTLLVCISCKDTPAQQKQDQVTEDNGATSHLAILDANGDGNLNPYEVLDVLLRLQKENKGDISIEDFKKSVTKYKEESEAEILEMFNSIDQNGDGKVEFSELEDQDDDFLVYAVQEADANTDKVVTLEEIKKLDLDAMEQSTEEDIKEEVDEFFEEYSKGEDYVDLVNLKNASKILQEDTNSWDKNDDNKLTHEEVTKGFESTSLPVYFEVKGDIAYMNGVIESGTPATVLELIFEHPEVKTIEMMNVPGSGDDVANLRASLYVRKFGLNTKVNSKSLIASGGSDFFLAGNKRTVEKGSIIGVHSWGGPGPAAADVPRDAEVHKKYLDYYEKVNIPTEFYWYTLEAAPADGMHNMTEAEIEKYNVRKD